MSPQARDMRVVLVHAFLLFFAQREAETLCWPEHKPQSREHASRVVTARVRARLRFQLFKRSRLQSSRRAANARGVLPTQNQTTDSSQWPCKVHTAKLARTRGIVNALDVMYG